MAREWKDDRFPVEEAALVAPENDPFKGTVMDAAERARKFWGDGQPGIMIKATAVLIRQAEQAARQDERRKCDAECKKLISLVKADERRRVLKEAAEVASRFGMAALSPSGVVVMKHCAEKIRALAEEVT